MPTARYISKLVNDIERNYETETSISKLLSQNNLFAVSNHTKEGVGTYVDIFAEDMAIARTIVTFSVDDAGRPFYNMDVIVRKFDGRDKQEILELLRQKYVACLETAQNNGGELLRNPLPEVNV